MIMAAKGNTDPEPAFGRWLSSVALVTPEEARSLKPLRIQVVTAAPGDTAESLSQRMTAVDRPLERFQVLNGLDRGVPVRAGQPYKLVAE
jgi:predicted Zn-dependent protease